METMGLGFLSGIVVGALIMFIPALSEALSIDKNNIHYKAGYKDGYKKREEEAEE